MVISFTLSEGSLWLKLTTRLKRKARPVDPVNLVLISSSRLVRKVSQRPQEKSLEPPKCSRYILPIIIFICQPCSALCPKLINLLSLEMSLSNRVLYSFSVFGTKLSQKKPEITIVWKKMFLWYHLSQLFLIILENLKNLSVVKYLLWNWFLATKAVNFFIRIIGKMSSSDEEFDPRDWFDLSKPIKRMAVRDRPKTQEMLAREK